MSLALLPLKIILVTIDLFVSITLLPIDIVYCWRPMVSSWLLLLLLCCSWLEGDACYFLPLTTYSSRPLTITARLHHLPMDRHAEKTLDAHASTFRASRRR